MSQKWASIIISGEKVNILSVDFEENQSFEVIADFSWALPTGDRPPAYQTIYETVANYLHENGIEFVVIKGSSTNLGGTKLAHLESAELRGVVIASASKSSKKVFIIKKSSVSKKIGKRNVDEYVADNEFWKDRLKDQDIRKASREGLLLIFAARGSK